MSNRQNTAEKEAINAVLNTSSDDSAPNEWNMLSRPFADALQGRNPLTGEDLKDSTVQPFTYRNTYGSPVKESVESVEEYVRRVHNNAHRLETKVQIDFLTGNVTVWKNFELNGKKLKPEKRTFTLASADQMEQALRYSIL